MRTFNLHQQAVYGAWAAVIVASLILAGLASAYHKAQPMIEARLVEPTTIGQRTLADPLAPASIAAPSVRE